ncbi:sterol desaturase family protein [Rugamonas aquatica]|nr:sterol desaturase family protein [Rugamonas aquatica]
MMGYGITFVILLLAVVVERSLLRRRGLPGADWHEIAANLGSGHLIMWVGRSLEVAGYDLVFRNVGWEGLQRHLGPGIWVAGFLGWDLCFYCMHRMHHRIPLLWKVHEVHHQGRDFSLSLGIRNSWYSSLTSLPFMLPLAVAGVSTGVFLAVSAIHYGIQFYNHLNPALARSTPWLDRVIVTPTNHLAHHGSASYYRNCNFGSVLLLWDRCFGSYRPVLSDVPVACGVGGWRPTANPLWMNHGSWRGAGVPRKCCLAGWYVGSGALLLFCAVALHVAGYGGPWRPMMMCGLIGGTMLLGAASDGSNWAAAGWCLLATAMCAPLWDRPEWMALPALAALALHGLLGAGILLKLPRPNSHKSPG